MISKIVNCKADQNSLKNEVVKNKKETNTGLRIPGANWQKFKNLVKEENTNEQSSDNIPIKRKKKRKRKPSQKASINLTNMTPQSSEVKQQKTTEANVKKEAKKKSEQETGLTRIIAMDCEMVGIGDGKDSMLARISIVNQHGVCVYDKYVKPTEEIADYRTAVSGIRPHHLQNGEDFKTVQKQVSEILKGRILVGHALHNDLTVLFLSHPKRFQRDTARYRPFRTVTKGSIPSLKKLASELLGVDIQSGEHNSIEDARTAMQIYLLFRKKWENEIRNR